MYNWSRSKKYQKKETTFHLPKDLVIALKTKAVQESRPYSVVVQEAIEKYLKEEIVKPVGHPQKVRRESPYRFTVMGRFPCYPRSRCDGSLRDRYLRIDTVLMKQIHGIDL